MSEQELQGNGWIEKMWRLWPFDHPYSPITFCPFAVPDMHDCQEMIFHFAVDYGSRDGVTVLVRQEIQIADDIPRGVPGLHEFWAVVMPHMEISEDPMEALEHPPFWQRYIRTQNMRMHMVVNAERYYDAVGPWHDGDVRVMKVYVAQKAQALAIMLCEGYIPDPQTDELITEQVGAALQKAEAPDSSFCEICIHLREKPWQQVDEAHDTDNSKGRLRRGEGGNLDPLNLHGSYKSTTRNDENNLDASLRHSHVDNTVSLGARARFSHHP